MAERRRSARIQKLKDQNNGKLSIYKENDLIEKQMKRLKKSKKPQLFPCKEVDEQVHEYNDEAEKYSWSSTTHLAKLKVKNTLRLFNNYYLRYVKEEENRARIAKENKEKNDAKTKSTSQRADLKAFAEINLTKSILYPEKKYGPIPGIDVGYKFFSRAEMMAIGFHTHPMSGIDYIGKTACSHFRAGKFLKECRRFKLPIAISIVLSGQYEDDLDNSESIVYTGQGGNDLHGRKRQIKNQKMEHGNLALKNSKEHGLPVRVTRKHQCESSYVKKVYTYDGLYKVVNYWAEFGLSGFIVYKFCLECLENQPPLTTTKVQFSRGGVSTSLPKNNVLVCDDISSGLEDFPIPVTTNLVNDPPVALTDLTYIRDLEISKNVKLPPTAPGCSCQGACTDPNICSCAKMNGSDFPYVSRDGGRLVEAKAVVVECGKNCNCGPDCVNRTSQKGIRYRLEVFRTPTKGWGVRSWDYIHSGAPICEYIGILMKTDDIDTTKETNYMFDIDCLQTMKGLGGREHAEAGGDVQLPMHLQNDDSDAGPEFCIDADSNGNVARYINHCCQPNLFVQCVLSDHHDPKQARIVFYAADNIPPLTELSYDYAYELDSVVGPDGAIIQLACYCGAVDCRKRLY